MAKNLYRVWPPFNVDAPTDFRADGVGLDEERNLFFWDLDEKGEKRTVAIVKEPFWKYVEKASDDKPRKSS